MNQSHIVKRIQSICEEFDARVLQVGLAIARLELAKALAECEANETLEKIRKVLSRNLTRANKIQQIIELTANAVLTISGGQKGTNA